MYLATLFYAQKYIGRAGRSDGITTASGMLARMIDEICVEATGHTCRNPPGMFLIDRGCSNLKFHLAENRPSLSFFLSFFLCIRRFFSSPCCVAHEHVGHTHNVPRQATSAFPRRDGWEVPSGTIHAPSKDTRLARLSFI